MSRLLLEPLRILVLAVPVTFAIYGAGACSDETGDVPDPALADVIYEGKAIDEALEVLLAATPQQVAGKGATFDSPTDGAAVPAATPITIAWHTGGTASLEPRRDPLSRSLEPVPLRETPRWAPLRELLGPERAARAHGDPVNGMAYWLVLSTESNDKLVRVFTTLTSYTPDAATWDKVKSAGAPITLSVVTAIFDNNQLASDGGPWSGTPVTFTVTP